MTEAPTGRNRSEGWAFAKKTGHSNEIDFGDRLQADHGFVQALENQKFFESSTISPIVHVDGAKKVRSILGDVTTSKIDITLDWGSSRSIGISLKKSLEGQVWLVTCDRFIQSIEFYTGSRMPSGAELALRLFIGGGNIAKFQDQYFEALKNDSVERPAIYLQEAKQSRLVAESIQANFPGAWDGLIEFFTINLRLITQLSFSRGFARSECDWADFVIYNNVGGAVKSFEISQIVEGSVARAVRVPILAGKKNGGSTICFPAGTLQMHHPSGDNQLQFRHSYKNISDLVNGLS